MGLSFLLACAGVTSILGTGLWAQPVASNTATRYKIDEKILFGIGVSGTFLKLQNILSNKKIFAIFMDSEYLSTLYPPDHNVMQNNGCLPEADKRQVWLILAYFPIYYFHIAWPT